MITPVFSAVAGIVYITQDCYVKALAVYIDYRELFSEISTNRTLTFLIFNGVLLEV
ncbi:hypothetical protein [Vibrio jasicida]|uniref:hypothetical protein n=1 Tax=Vibrio jasicida TaxID=766224 RepID=UPI00163E311F|nr:hypothetical protein [Vibrio jasicida]